jgi:predicted  nucleic acid-binding Zn-ribbon protein
MMSQNPFKLFLSLVAFDNSLRELEETIKQVQGKKEELLQQKEQLASVVEKLKQQEHAMRKEVDMHELHMKELDQKERSKKHQLDDINTPKEYTVVKREIEAIQREQHDHEQTLMQVWNSLESVHKTFETKQEELAGAVTALDSQLAALDAQEDQMENAYDAKMAERTQHLAGIPEEWLEKYRAMQYRVTDPVVPVQQGSCSACFYDITEQKLVALKRHALLQCEGCYRFLYIPEKAENSEQSVGKDS